MCEFSVSIRPCERRRKILSEYSDPCACRARRRRPLLHCERGAVAIEFALVIGLLIALVLGILQIGLAIQQRGAMERTLSLEIRRAQIDEGVSDDVLRERLSDRLERQSDGKVTITFESLNLDDEDLPYRRVIVAYPYRLQIPPLTALRITMRADAIARQVN